MWRALRERYEARTTSTRVHLLSRLHALKYKPRHQTFQDYCLCFDKIIRELKEAAETTDDSGIVILFLITTPDDYEPIVAPIQAMIDKDSTMAYVRVMRLGLHGQETAGTKSGPAKMFRSILAK